MLIDEEITVTRGMNLKTSQYLYIIIVLYFMTTMLLGPHVTNKYSSGMKGVLLRFPYSSSSPDHDIRQDYFCSIIVITMKTCPIRRIPVVEEL